MNQVSKSSGSIIQYVGLITTLVFVTNSSSALMIDDFSQGTLSIQVTNLTGQTIFQDGLPTSSVLAGSRSVYAGSLGLGTAQVDTTAGQFKFSADSSFGYFSLIYGSASSPLGVDLTSGGNNSFQLNIAEHTQGFSRSGILLSVDTGNGWNSYEFGRAVFQINGPIAMIIPFAKFVGSDMTQVQAVQISSVRFEPTFHIAFDSITTIPEPSAAGIFSTGLLLMVRWRSRH